MIRYYSTSSLGEKYINHHVFKEIEYIANFYDNLSDGCLRFVPTGTNGILNYASYIFMSINGTLESIGSLLKAGRINDAIVLVRKLFDDVLVEIYIDVVRKENFDWEENYIVKDVDEWIKRKHRIPSLKKILSVLQDASSTKDLYPFFGWESYLKHNREILDDSVHANRFKLMLLNCKELNNVERTKHLDGILIILKQIFTIHLAFIVHLNGQYLMASDYMDCLDAGDTPPEGSESWIAPYAQEAFDRYIKPMPRLASFLIKECGLKIE